MILCRALASKASMAKLSVVLVFIIANFSLGQGRDQKGGTGNPNVMVELGKPNVWTLEQATYLLERNRQRDLGAKIADLGELDPNDIVGQRVQSRRSLLSGQVEYDASLPAKNRTAQQTYALQKQQYDRFHELSLEAQTRERKLRLNSIEAQHTLDMLQANGADAKSIAVQTAQLNRLKALHDEAAEEAKSYDDEAGSAPGLPSPAAGSISDTYAPPTALDQDANFAGLVSKASGAPLTKMAASIRLDNHVNAEYELVAKQLTLMRAQAGPNNQVLFVELPQSIYVANKLRMYPYLGSLWGAHLVQSWWRLDEALLALPPKEITLDPRAPTSDELRSLAYEYTSKEYTSEKALCAPNTQALAAFFHPNTECAKQYNLLHSGQDDLERISNLYAQAVRYRTDRQQEQARLTPTGFKEADKVIREKYGSNVNEQILAEVERRVGERFKSGDSGKCSSSSDCAADQAMMDNWIQQWQFRLLLTPQEYNRPNTADEFNSSGSETALLSSAPQPEPMYALDLIPRQSALNVSDAQLSTHNFGFAGLFKFLSGVGVRTKFERQSNDFSQFVQQETYASAFGKGSYEFGWTFGPLPGTNRIAPGLRTTYAIIVVPRQTRVVRMYGMGCGYRRRDVPVNPFTHGELEGGGEKDYHQHRVSGEDCGPLSTFDVEVPNEQDELYVRKISYPTVRAGQRVAIEIEGRFGEQTGVLIKGVPLQKVVSISQTVPISAPFNIPDNQGSELGIKGAYEVIRGEQIIVSLAMQSSDAGIPDIVLTSPTGAKRLRDLPIWGKGNEDVAHASPLFTQSALISRVDVSPILDRDPGNPGVATLRPDLASVKVVGRGFSGMESDSVYLGTKRLTVDESTQPADNTYARLSDTVLVARVSRDLFFPSSQLDYIQAEQNEATDATFTVTDTLPPHVTSCTFTKGKDADSKGEKYSFVITGEYFSQNYVPAVTLKKASLTSLLVDSTHWTLDVTIPQSEPDVVPLVNLTKAKAAPLPVGGCKLR